MPSKGAASGETAAPAVNYRPNRTGGVRGRTFNGLSGLKVQWQGKLLDEAARLARKGHHLDAAETFDRSGALPEQQAKYADKLAYAFYRRALTHQSDLDKFGAIGESPNSCPVSRPAAPTQVANPQSADRHPERRERGS